MAMVEAHPHSQLHIGIKHTKIDVNRSNILNVSFIGFAGVYLTQYTTHVCEFRRDNS